MKQLKMLNCIQRIPQSHLKYLLSIGYLLLTILVYGQEIPTKNFTIQHGLPSNTVYDIVSDDKGYIWISTDNGVARFNGETFKHFGLNEGLPDIEVLKLFKGEKNKIWALCYNGQVASIDEDGIVESVIDEDMVNDFGSFTFYSGSYRAKKGEIYLTQGSNGAVIFKNDTITSQLKDFFINSYFSTENNTYTLYREKMNDQPRIWNIEEEKLERVLNLNTHIASLNNAETQSHVFLFCQNEMIDIAEIVVINKSDLTYEKIPFPAGSQHRVYNLKSIGNFIYITVSDGLYRFDYNTRAFEKILPGKYTSIEIDVEGNLWLCSLENGLTVLYFKSNIIDTDLKIDIHKLAYNATKNKIYYGSDKILGSYDLSSKQIEEVAAEKGSKLYNIYVDDQYCYYCYNSAIFYGHIDNLKRISISCKTIKKDKYNDDFMIGTSFGVQRASDIENIRESVLQNNFTRRVRGISLAQQDSTEWLVGSSDRLYTFSDTQLVKDNIMDVRVNNMFVDSHDNTWLVSELSGIFYKNGANIRSFDDLFPHQDGSYTAATISNDTLWFTDNTSIHYIASNGETFDSGSYHINTTDQYKKANDIVKIGSVIYLATDNGLLSFAPHKYIQENNPPILQLSELLVNGTRENRNKSLRLGHHQNNIILKFDVIKYVRPDLNYKYKLNPDKEWNTTKQDELLLANLSPGEYNVSVYAEEATGLKSNIIQLPFTIKPPFHKTTFFYLLLGGLLALVIYIRYKIKLNRLRQKAIIDKQLSSSQQKALRAQMNPHFLFNALNSIQQFFLDDNDIDGQEYISKFSRLIRNTLDNSEKDLLPIAEELDNLQHYVELEQLRTKYSFAYHTEIDPSINLFAETIPSMILQPIVENSIWHGIRHLEDTSGKITITINKTEASDIIISIQDNGVGRKASKKINKSKNHISKGTTLINQRIKAINGARDINIKMTTKDNSPRGTIVIIKIPGLI